MEIKTLEIEDTETRTNEKIMTIAEYHNVNLKVSYFWDNHGKLINWTEFVEQPTSWSGVNVRVDEYSFSQTFDFLNKTMDFKETQLFVDNERISGDVVDISRRRDKDGTITVYCKLVIGWG